MEQMTEQTSAQTKLAILVNKVIGPAISDFVASLTDAEILEALSNPALKKVY